jgi:hypothetical protein
MGMALANQLKIIKMSFALCAAVLIVTLRVHLAMDRPRLNASCVSQIDFRSTENVSTAVPMVIMEIRKGRSVSHAQLDVPPVAATSA